MLYTIERYDTYGNYERMLAEARTWRELLAKRRTAWFCGKAFICKDGCKLALTRALAWAEEESGTRCVSLKAVLEVANRQKGGEE